MRCVGGAVDGVEDAGSGTDDPFGWRAIPHSARYRLLPPTPSLRRCHMIIVRRGSSSSRVRSATGILAGRRGAQSTIRSPLLGTIRSAHRTKRPHRITRVMSSEGISLRRTVPTTSPPSSVTVTVENGHPTVPNDSSRYPTRTPALNHRPAPKCRSRVLACYASGAPIIRRVRADIRERRQRGRRCSVRRNIWRSRDTSVNTTGASRPHCRESAGRAGRSRAGSR